MGMPNRSYLQPLILLKLTAEEFPYSIRFSFLYGASKLCYLLLDGVKLKGLRDSELGDQQGVLNSQAPIKLLKAMCQTFHKFR